MSVASRILITGGAGFIGSHVADALLARGYRVRVLDSLSEQVHGGRHAFPDYLSGQVEAVQGDVRDRDAVERALHGVEAVFHFASMVGVGQSMYQIEKYVDVNNRGTAVLLEALLARPVSKLVVASSMSVYGEGLYRDGSGHSCEPQPRSREQLKAARWELTDAQGSPLEPVATPESKTPMPESIYALSKYDQEKMCLLFGRSYNVPVTALRFFNVYGERQALSNPYTGVLAIFASRIANRQAPMIFEDGAQQRDFVHVRDVARAFLAALDRPEADGEVFNIGSGEVRTVAEVAVLQARAMGRPDLEPEITGKSRAGDIRHCIPDLAKAQGRLGWRAREDFADGLAELAEWVGRQEAQDRVVEARRELELRGLVA